MKNKSILLTFFIISIFQHVLQAQTPQEQRFFIEIASGGELARWQILKENPVDKLVSIYKTSIDKLSLPVKLALSYRVKRFQIGAELKNQYIFITTVNDPSAIEGENNPGELKLTDLSGFNFTTLIGLVRYILVNTETFKMTPAIGIGSFIEKTIENKKAELKNLISYKFAFQQEFHKDNRYFFINPQLLVNRYMTLNNLEINRIITAGVEIGVGFKFPLQKKRTTYKPKTKTTYQKL